MSHPSVFSFTFSVPQSVIDENGHVNNVAFVQWMQDAAIRHGQQRMAGYNGYNLDTAIVLNETATFVVREHRIEYVLPVFQGDEIEVRTWLNEARRVRLHRRYDFIRKSDTKVV